MTQSPQPGEILSGARGRLLGCADDDERHWSMDPREGWAVDVPVADLRLIISAYDRQAEEIERLRGMNPYEADLWWNPGNDEAGFTHYAGAFEDANEDGEDYSVELNRGIVLPSVWAALIDGKVKVFATEAEADAARARQGGPDNG